jgi:hypothetical protein
LKKDHGPKVKRNEHYRVTVGDYCMSAEGCEFTHSAARVGRDQAMSLPTNEKIDIADLFQEVTIEADGEKLDAKTKDFQIHIDVAKGKSRERYTVIDETQYQPNAQQAPKRMCRSSPKGEHSWTQINCRIAICTLCGDRRRSRSTQHTVGITGPCTNCGMPRKKALYEKRGGNLSRSSVPTPRELDEIATRARREYMTLRRGGDQLKQDAQTFYNYHFNKK